MELLYPCVPVFYGESTQDNIFGDFTMFFGSLHWHTGGKEFGVAPAREHPNLILGKPEPKGCSWPVSKTGSWGAEQGS